MASLRRRFSNHISNTRSLFGTTRRSSTATQNSNHQLESSSTMVTLSTPPAYTDSEPSQSQRISIKAVADATRKDILITITPPAEPDGAAAIDGDIKGKRAPVDFVLTIDISGSMGEMANIPGDTGQSTDALRKTHDRWRLTPLRYYHYQNKAVYRFLTSSNMLLRLSSHQCKIRIVWLS